MLAAHGSLPLTGTVGQQHLPTGLYLRHFSRLCFRCDCCQTQAKIPRGPVVTMPVGAGRASSSATMNATSIPDTFSRHPQLLAARRRRHPFAVLAQPGEALCVGFKMLCSDRSCPRCRTLCSPPTAYRCEARRRHAVNTRRCMAKKQGPTLRLGKRPRPRLLHTAAAMLPTVAVRLPNPRPGQNNLGR